MRLCVLVSFGLCYTRESVLLLRCYIGVENIGSSFKGGRRHLIEYPNRHKIKPSQQPVRERVNRPAAYLWTVNDRWIQEFNNWTTCATFKYHKNAYSKSRPRLLTSKPRMPIAVVARRCTGGLIPQPFMARPQPTATQPNQCRPHPVTATRYRTQHKS